MRGRPSQSKGWRSVLYGSLNPFHDRSLPRSLHVEELLLMNLGIQSVMRGLAAVGSIKGMIVSFAWVLMRRARM